MNRRDPPVVLVTGATTGIGLALAKLLIAGTWRVVLTARASSLPRFASEGIFEDERILIRPLDVTQTTQSDELVAEINARWGGVDVLVNNAGIIYRAVIEHLCDHHEQEQFLVNYLGPLHLIRLVIPQMRARRRGRIINLSSVGGMMAMPTMGGYSASKFALEGASEALWYELKPWGISVTLIEPGFVNSDSFLEAKFTESSCKAFNDPSQDYHPYYVHLIAFITKMMRLSPTNANDVARTILKVMNKKWPPLRQPATLDAFFFSMLRRLLPQRFYNQFLFWNLPKIRSWVPKPQTDPSEKQN